MVPADSIETDVLMENGLWESLVWAEALDCILVLDVVWIQKLGQEELVVAERPFVVHNDHQRDVGDAGLLCLSPYPCSHVLRRHCSL